MSKKALTCVFVTGLCLTATAALAAPLQKGRINPKANWAVHADIDAFRNSAIGKLVLAELKAQGVEDKMQDFVTIFSFNPLQDIRDVTLYGQGSDRNNAVVIVDGKFDPEKLLTVIRWNPQYEEISHEGVTLYRWLNEDKKKQPPEDQIMYGYIHEGRQVAISTGLDTLKQAVDTLKSLKAGASSDLLKGLAPGPNGTFLQISATGVGQMAGQDPKAAILQQTDSLALTAGETGDKAVINARLTGASPEVAENMVKLLQGVVAMAQLAAQEQPKLSELAKNVTISREDKVTQVRFEAPAESIMAFLKEQWAKKQQQ